MFPFKVLEEKYNSVPENVRQAISSTEVSRKLRTIVDNYRLQFDEGEELTKEIGYVMLGLKSSDDFVKNIQKATELDKPTAEKIAEDVNNIILKDIKNSLRESTQKPDYKDDEDIFNEEEQERVRGELMTEIENSKEKTTDLIKIPEQPTSSTTLRGGENKDILSETPKDKKLKITTILNEISPTPAKSKTEEVSNMSSQATPDKITTTPEEQANPTVVIEEKTNELTKEVKQKLEKKYIIDPYREPLE